MAIYSPWGINSGAGVVLAAAGNKTLSLLHGDGTDASTTFTDEMGHTWGALSGGQLTTSIKQFGTASITGNTTNDGCTTSDADLLALMTASGFWQGDWTVECWARKAVGLAIGEAGVTFSTAGVGNTIQLNSDTIISFVRVILRKEDQTDIFSEDTTVTLTDATFYHMAVVKEGTEYSVFFNGDRIRTSTNAATLDGDTTTVQVRVDTGAGRDTCVDEVRISNVARYAGATYDIPASAFTVD